MSAVSRAPEDSQLVVRARDGDQRAFGQLYHRYARQIARAVHRVMGTDMEVDDIVQTTFIEAAKGLAGLRETTTFGGYCLAIAVRLSTRVLRQRRRRALLSSIFGATQAPPADSASPRASVDVLYEALDSLSVQLRTPWVLHRLEEYTLPEVAVACSVSLATVKRRIAKAEELLTRRLHAR